jgi:hypothetical protein
VSSRPPRRVPCFEEDWGEELTTRIDAYMHGLYASLDEDGDPDPDTLTGYPFCGCDVCEERERMFITVLLTLEGVEAGRVRLEEA